MKKCTIVLFTTFFANSLFSLDFEQLKNYTILNSKQLKVKNLDIFISNKELDIVKSEIYPEISVGLNIESSKSLEGANTSTSVGGDTISNDSLQKSYSYVNLNYNLYSFGRFESKVKTQEYQIESVNYDYCLEKKNIIINLLDSYYNARNHYNNNDYLQEIIDKKNKLYNYNQKLFNLGNITKLQLMKSSIEVADLYSQITNNKKQLKEYIEKLSNISSYEFLENENLDPLYIENLEFKNSFENTTNAKLIQSQIKTKKAELSLQKKEFMPNLNFYSKYDVYGSDKSSFKESLKDMKENSYKLGLNLSWNVFNGFKTTSLKEKTILELKQLQHKYDLEKDNFETQVNILNQNYELDTLNLKHKNQSLEIALANEDYSKRLNKVGEIDKLEEINFKIEKLYKELEYKTSKEKLAYEHIKKTILLQDSKCIVR